MLDDRQLGQLEDIETLMQGYFDKAIELQSTRTE